MQVPRVIYEMGGVSPDGHVVGPDGKSDPSDIVREFALIWQAPPKVVFSRTLDSVEGANTTLTRDDLRVNQSPVKEIIMTHISTTTAAVGTR
jgi:hypothetical protein